MQYTKGIMATAKKPQVKNPAKSRVAKVAKKAPAAKVKKVTAKKFTPKAPVSNKVDYYPNRMTFWVSAAAGSLIVLIAVICAYNR